MKTLTNLTATPAEGKLADFPGPSHSFLDLPARNFPIHFSFGFSGLLISRGPNIVVGIPLAELLKLAQSAEPGLIPPLASPVPSPGAPADA